MVTKRARTDTSDDGSCVNVVNTLINMTSQNDLLCALSGLIEDLLKQASKQHPEDQQKNLTILVMILNTQVELAKQLLEKAESIKTKPPILQ